MQEFTKQEYCQYLLSSPLNYMRTNLAEHLDGVSHDRVNRYMKSEKLTPRLLWQEVEGDIGRCCIDRSYGRGMG